MSNKILQMRHERQARIVMARGLLDSAEAAKRELNADEEKRYGDLMSEIASIDARIEREEHLAKMEGGQDQIVRNGVRPDVDDATIGMSNAEIRKYSLVRLINAMATGDWRKAGFEREASEATAKRLGITPQGAFVPYDWFASQKRDLTVGTNSAGGYTKATELMAGDFITLLRNRTVVANAGATILDGLVGDIAIPRHSGAATAYWVAESGAPTESQQTFEQVAMSPKTLGGYTDLSRKLLKQSSISVENFVGNDLASILGIEIDRASMHGSGSSNQPTGIAATSGIGSVAGGTNGLAPAWTHIVALETEVSIDNADLGGLAYITNPKVRGKLKAVAVGTDQRMVWDNNNTPLNGYPAYVTNQVSSTLTKGTSSGVCSAIFFGNWQDLFIGMWGGLDLMTDPYTGGTSGTVRVIALQDVDIAVRHPESFAAMLDALTS